MQSGVSQNHPLVVSKLFLPTDHSTVEWKKFREGIDICRLYSEAGGSSAALLRYARGACLDRHVHVGYEHVLILSGSQIDDAGEHHAGTLLIHAPGSSHAIASPSGCIVLAVWEKAVHFPADAEAAVHPTRVP